MIAPLFATNALPWESVFFDKSEEFDTIEERKS